MMEKKKISTKSIHGNEYFDPLIGAFIIPIFQSNIFTFLKEVVLKLERSHLNIQEKIILQFILLKRKFHYLKEEKIVYFLVQEWRLYQPYS